MLKTNVPQPTATWFGSGCGGRVGCRGRCFPGRTPASRFISEAETWIAMARGLVQIVAVGSILVILLRAPRWTSGFLLAGMMIVRRRELARRAKGHARRVSVSPPGPSLSEPAP